MGAGRPDFRDRPGSGQGYPDRRGTCAGRDAGGRLEFLKELAASGLRSQTIAQRDFGVRRVLDEAGAAANGTLIVTEYSPDLQGDLTRAWNTSYSKHYGGDANIIAAQYYDALMLVAAEHQVKTDPQGWH